MPTHAGGLKLFIAEILARARTPRAATGSDMVHGSNTKNTEDLMNRRTSALVASLLIALSSTAVCAQETEADEFSGKPYWEALIGPFAVHWSNDDEHQHVYLLGIERAKADGFIWGFSAFNNSFGQPSAYAYYGYRWDNLFDEPKWYAKISAGIIYGYKGKYEDKVPFNHDGFGLGIIPAIGYRVTPKDAIQVGALGAAGLIFTYNRRF